jgi:hypothetical protein
MQNKLPKLQTFSIIVPVKPYIKRFLHINYGTPANFGNDAESYRFLRNCLRKPNTRYDSKYSDEIHSYSETIRVIISEDDFYRYGWELSKTDTVAFGKRFEDRAKALMRSIVTVYHGFGLTIKESIIRFQDKFGLEEEYWPYESIKKEYYRKRPDVELDFYDEILNKINHIFMVNLSPNKDSFTKGI